MADLKLYNATGESVSYSGITQVVIPNVASGSTIFTDTSDANAAASDILNGKTAYVNGSKITGTYEGGGGGELKEFIEQHDTITSFEDPGCSIIGSFAFISCWSLTTISFPACTTIGRSAFECCYSLTTANFPACTIISNCAFKGCSRLTTISFPVCTTISSNAFEYCSNLITASFPACTIIGNQAFEGCYSLTTVSFPACTDIGGSVFYLCRGLTTVSFPACTTIGKAFGGTTFYLCSNLTTCIFSNTTMASSIYSSAFYKCYNLLSLYLLGSTLYKLQNINVFNSTPISNYTSSTSGINGSIFVPQSLLTSYQAATNWVTYSARFVGLTDDEVSRVMASGTHLA